MDYQNLRKEYRRNQLNECNLYSNPYKQFNEWFQDVLQEKIEEPNAMTLATATKEGKPSARVVLLKEVDENGFIFYTNKESRKGQELKENPEAELLFYWFSQQRQVRISGTVELLSEQESQAYFQTRPLGSQLGAWASKQSQALENREQLEQAFHEAEEKYKGRLVPMPPYWGGYRVRPNRFEFWQGRSNRLHDRLVYSLDEKNNKWLVQRLYP